MASDASKIKSRAAELGITARDLEQALDKSFSPSVGILINLVNRFKHLVPDDDVSVLRALPELLVEAFSTLQDVLRMLKKPDSPAADEDQSLNPLSLTEEEDDDDGEEEEEEEYQPLSAQAKKIAAFLCVDHRGKHNPRLPAARRTPPPHVAEKIWSLLPKDRNDIAFQIEPGKKISAVVYVVFKNGVPVDARRVEVKKVTPQGWIETAGFGTLKFEGRTVLYAF